LRSLKLVTLVDILNFTSYLLEHLSVEAAAHHASFSMASPSGGRVSAYIWAGSGDSPGRRLLRGRMP
jgi:hypothetical protein